MKRKKRQQGFTLVETIVACALLMMLISIFGSITIFTLNLSYREKEAAQVEILADTLANRVDEILRDAQYVNVKYENGKLKYVEYYSPKYPKYYDPKLDESGNPTDEYSEVPTYAKLHVPGESGDGELAGKLCIGYSGKDYPVGYLLLPNDSYEHMTASLSVVSEETIPDGADSMEMHGAIRMNITLNGTKYHTSYSRDFTVLLPNCE